MTVRVSKRYTVGIHLAAVLVSLVILAPFAWMALASVSEPADLISVPYHWIPKHWTFFRYREILHGNGQDVAGAFRQSIVNSTIVASGTDRKSVV